MAREDGLRPETLVVHAGLPEAQPGEPFLPGPVLASAYHLPGPADAAPYGYTRDGNPTWANYERAWRAMEDAEAVLFASGMAAVSALLLPGLKPGDVLVAPTDGYPGVRKLAEEQLAPLARGPDGPHRGPRDRRCAGGSDRGGAGWRRPPTRS